MKCETCKSEMKEIYRFTDWDNEANDRYGSFEECKKLFNKAVSEQEDKRVSIYDQSYCSECENYVDEGVMFNEKCPEYM